MEEMYICMYRIDITCVECCTWYCNKKMDEIVNEKIITTRTCITQDNF